MQYAIYNIISCARRLYITLILLIVTASPAFSQPDTGYLSPAHNHLIISPQKYLLTSHVDFMVGPSRVYRGDHSGVGLSAAVKGVYQVGNFWHLNVGFGYTELTSKRLTPTDTVGITHFANILYLPIGLSFIIGDDRFQAITTTDILPGYYIDNSRPDGKPEKFTWGTSTEFGFILKIHRYWYLGLTGKLQVFQHFDRSEKSWPQYGFVGIGPMIRLNY